MGWLYNEKWTRKSLIEERIKTEVVEREESKLKTVFTTLAHCYKGLAYSGVLWSVVEIEHINKQNKKVASKRLICCDLIKYTDGQWGYKDLVEADHPCYYSCPPKYLKMVPAVTNLAWRDKVLSFHQGTLEKAKATRKRNERERSLYGAN